MMEELKKDIRNLIWDYFWIKHDKNGEPTVPVDIDVHYLVQRLEGIIDEKLAPPSPSNKPVEKEVFCPICVKDVPYNGVMLHNKEHIYRLKHDGFKYKEIAELMSLSIHTVQSYYHSYKWRLIHKERRANAGVMT